MSEMTPRLRWLFSINANFTMAFVLGFLAYSLYPDNLKGFGWGIIAILLGASSIGVLLKTLKRILDRYDLEKELYDIYRDRKRQEGTSNADHGRLRNGGVIRD